MDMTDWQENTRETRKLFALAQVHKIGVIWLVYLYFLDHNLENIMILHFPYLFWWSNCSNESSWWYLRRSRTKWRKVSLLSSFCGLLWAWAWVSWAVWDWSVQARLWAGRVLQSYIYTGTTAGLSLGSPSTKWRPTTSPLRLRCCHAIPNIRPSLGKRKIKFKPDIHCIFNFICNTAAAPVVLAAGLISNQSDTS